MSRVSFGGVELRTYAQQAAAAEESEDLTGAAAGPEPGRWAPRRAYHPHTSSQWSCRWRR